MKHYKIDQYFEFTFQTQAFATGTATDADSLPTWRVYEENNDTVITNNDCAKKDDSNTAGYYYARGQCTTASGFEVGKTYEVRVAAIVSSVSGAGVIGRFAILPSNVWDSLYGGTDYLQADAVQVEGSDATDQINDACDTAISDAGVTTARMGALTDWIDGGRLDLLLDALLTRLTATRAGYLDNLMTAPPSASDIATAVWAAGTRTLSSFGTLVADVATAVWGAVARTITGGTITTNSDKTGYTLTGTDLADIKAKTDQLTFTTPGSVDATATVDTSDLATSANQTTIINHLTDVKGATFSGATDSLEAIRNRGDVAWITGGTGGGSNAVTINVKDDSAVNVVDCYVEVWDSAGTSFISRTNTNSSGNVTFNLDSNTYTVKMHKTGYYFANQTLIVDGVESVAYTGTILTPTAPTDPSLCKVYGYYFDPSGNTFPAIKSMVKMSVAYEAADNNYYVESINGTYNTTTGELSFNIVQGADAVLDIPFLNIKKRFTVPAETLYKISDII